MQSAQSVCPAPPRARVRLPAHRTSSFRPAYPLVHVAASPLPNAASSRTNPLSSVSLPVRSSLPSPSSTCSHASSPPLPARLRADTGVGHDHVGSDGLRWGLAHHRGCLACRVASHGSYVQLPVAVAPQVSYYTYKSAPGSAHKPRAVEPRTLAHKANGCTLPRTTHTSSRGSRGAVCDGQAAFESSGDGDGVRR
jgi:hypothetical protein